MLSLKEVRGNDFAPFIRTHEGITPNAFYKDRLVLKVDNVVSEQTMAKAKQEILSHPVNSRDALTHRSRIDVLGGEYIDLKLTDNGVEMETYFNYYELELDDSGQIQCDMALQKQFESNNIPPGLRDLAQEGILKMASELGWKNTRIPFMVNILRYDMDKSTPSLTDFPWHRDLNSLSMTVLISPYSDGAAGFRGAELSVGERVSSYEEYSSRSDKKEPTTIAATTKSYEYPYRGGFIFDNLGSEHKVHDMSLLDPEYPYERWLLTVFANPLPTEVERLMDVHKDRNEALTQESKSLKSSARKEPANEPSDEPS